MQRLGAESIETGSVFLWRAKTLVAISLMSENKHEEAINLLE